MNAIKTTFAFTKRNIKVFLKDKGAVISALISPLVILLLYVLFLHGVMQSSFTNVLGSLKIDSKLINGYVASYEVSSILATCCVTVAFVVNMIMVDDKITGVRADLTVSPANKNTLVLGYYFATAIITVAVCCVAMTVGFIYIAAMGWYLATTDVFLIVLDVFLASLFGTALSSVITYFLKSRGAVNAVSTIVSTVYGFICGAYYPISQFAKAIANTVMCLPGTYCTGLLRAHFMSCFVQPFTDAGMPPEAARSAVEAFDAKMYFFGKAVPIWAMYTVVCVTVAALIGAFVLINVIANKKRRKAVAALKGSRA